MKAILRKHPELDFFIGFMGGPVVPTKQDKFKRLDGYQIIAQEDEGEEIDLTFDNDLYLKKKGSSGHLQFEEDFKKLIRKNLTEEHPYPLDVKLEVIVSVSMDEKRLKLVDIDNIVKSVLDCFNGLVYVDDSQIMNVLGQKEVNGFAPLNGLFVGIRKIVANNSWFDDIKLAYFEYED